MEAKYLAAFAILAVVIAITSPSQGSPVPASVPVPTLPADYEDVHYHIELTDDTEQHDEPAKTGSHREARYFLGGYPGIGGGMAGASASATASASAGGMGMGYGGYPLLYG